ncbi:MAG TPA: hypothetical protein VHQ41_03880 [Patescibacteria group bacterium]|nr:hypothetical protein [Patescibacteria group bacterium]
MDNPIVYGLVAASIVALLLYIISFIGGVIKVANLNRKNEEAYKSWIDDQIHIIKFLPQNIDTLTHAGSTALAMSGAVLWRLGSFAKTPQNFFGELLKSDLQMSENLTNIATPTYFHNDSERLTQFFSYLLFEARKAYVENLRQTSLHPTRKELQSRLSGLETVRVWNLEPLITIFPRWRFTENPLIRPAALDASFKKFKLRIAYEIINDALSDPNYKPRIEDGSSVAHIVQQYGWEDDDIRIGQGDYEKFMALFPDQSLG